MSKIGEISYNSKGEKMTIVEYRNSQDIDIMFDDGTIVKNKRYWNFRKGNVLNPFTPSVYGAGYLGNSSCKENGEYKRAYEVWRSMIERCYSSEYHKRQQTYIAYECYCKARKKYLSELAEQYKQYLDFRAYEILIDWKEGL